MSSLHDEVISLKKQTDTVILAHNYQIPEVQDVADYIGDSLGLARQAAKTPHSRIIFCGVHFMAETASIISPEKRVLIPDLTAGCSLADSITLPQLQEWKAQHPGAVSVGYVNTTAEIKAELDYCCTSSNAVSVINSIAPDRHILFLPDMFLGAYVAKITGRKNISIWAGECHVHAGIRPEDIEAKLASMRNAEFVIHPECSCSTPIMYDNASGRFGQQVQVLSTEGMMKHVSKSDAKEFVVATETGILYRMRKQNPDKKIVAASDTAECEFMKKITLKKVHRSLVDDVFEVRVPDDIAARARMPIDRMLAIT